MTAGPCFSRTIRWPFDWRPWSSYAPWTSTSSAPLIEGTLAEEDPNLQGFLKPLRPKSADKKCSSIYLNCFVNRSGQGPSKEGLLRIMDVVERYVGDDEELAKAIDHQVTIGHFQCKRGHRRYLMDRNKTWKQGRKETILLFCGNLRRRLQVSGSSIRVLTEAGFTNGPSNRAGEHAKHSSSNYLMNLFEAAAKYLGLSYRMKFLVVLHCFRSSHGKIGETLVTRLAQAYTSYGGGFSHHPAGQSTKGESTFNYQAKQSAITSDAAYRSRVEAEFIALKSNSCMACGLANLLTTRGRSPGRIVDEVAPSNHSAPGSPDAPGPSRPRVSPSSRSSPSSSRSRSPSRIVDQAAPGAITIAELQPRLVKIRRIKVDMAEMLQTMRQMEGRGAAQIEKVKAALEAHDQLAVEWEKDDF
jgi:hypothetical protein